MSAEARALRRPGWLVAVAVAMCACGSSSASTSATSPSGGTPPLAGSPLLNGSLTVLAASSLSGAFQAAEVRLEGDSPGFHATYSFAGSQQLVQNVIDGAPADVIATADAVTMQRLVNANLVMTPAVFVHNRLEIAVAPGNPKHIHTLADLQRADVSVVLADSNVPAGKYAQQALATAGVHVTPKSLELNAAAALEKVVSGDADAAIVYVTDVAGAAGTVAGVAIPDAINVVATYEVAVLRSTRNPAGASAFVSAAVSGTIQAELLRRGFLPP